jgi:hypothetical protein
VAKTVLPGTEIELLLELSHHLSAARLPKDAQLAYTCKARTIVMRSVNTGQSFLSFRVGRVVWRAQSGTVFSKRSQDLVHGFGQARVGLLHGLQWYTKLGRLRVWVT